MTTKSDDLEARIEELKAELRRETVVCPVCLGRMERLDTDVPQWDCGVCERRWTLTTGPTAW